MITTGNHHEEIISTKEKKPSIEEFKKQLAEKGLSEKEIKIAYQTIARFLIEAEEESGVVPSNADKIVQNLLMKNLAYLKKQYNEVSYGK